MREKEMVMMMMASAARFLKAVLGSKVLWAGVGLLVLGTGPLLLTIYFDPTSNPIGVGMLTFFTFWPSLLLIAAGLIHGVVRALRGERPIAGPRGL